MLAQHTDESFRADDVRFRNAGGAVVQVLMRSDFLATEAFFCDHGRYPFLEQRRGPNAGSRAQSMRIDSTRGHQAGRLQAIRDYLPRRDLNLPASQRSQWR